MKAPESKLPESRQQTNTSPTKQQVTPVPSDHVAQNATAPNDLPVERPVESGGQTGPEPTRYGDWEKKGRCTDF